MSTEQLEYELDGVTFTDVTDEIGKIWEQMQQPDSQVTKVVDSAELEELKNHSVNEVMAFDKGSAFAGEAALIIAFAPVAAKITRDVWDHFILPRLIDRFGPDAIKLKKGRK